MLLDVDGASLYAHNVYAPVDYQENQRFFAHLSATATFEDEDSRIVMGDPNLRMHPKLDANIITSL